MKQLLALSFLVISVGALGQITPKWTRYPAISPDGSKIAFCYMGDIYVVSSSGGQAMQLTSNPAYDYAPTWSHDGTKIAFASDRYGNFDVFTVPSTGGATMRITFHSNNDIPWSFTNDNSRILFTSIRQDKAESALFPSGVLSELYSVPSEGGRVKQELGVPAEHASYSKDGKTLIYQNRKGYEDPWRKHHTSYVTRDIWSFDPESGKHTQLTNWLGEDRDPLFANDGIYFLSERESDNFNIWKMDNTGKNAVRITNYTDHPVRFLSMSDNGTACYFYRGDIYTYSNGASKKLNVTLSGVDKTNDFVRLAVNGKATEIALSPNEKEMAFVVRGEVYVTSIDHSTTKRITDTPQQERNISFSPDGKKILFASEREGSWNIYEVSKADADEEYFFLSTVLKEKGLVVTDDNTFQPAYSPDGKEIAYLYKRTGIQIKNLASGKTRTLLEPRNNYSYSDGDQGFKWSPDGKWLATEYLDNNRWMSDLALIATDGKSEPINITESGYGESSPMWMDKGNILLFFSDRNGLRAQASWGAQSDVYALYLNQKTYDKYNLPKDEYELKYQKNGSRKKESDSDKKKEDEDGDKAVETIVVDLENIRERVKRLTMHSSSLSGAVLSAKGDKLYYLSRFEKGFDLWSQDLIKKETKLVAKLNGFAVGLEADKAVSNLFVLDQGKIFKLDLKSKGQKKMVSFSSHMNYRPMEERRYIFNHAWRQVKEKFYLPELHGVDWAGLKTEYETFLPHINNGYDFAEMLGELLGELNASHTGARYFDRKANGDRTASFGLIYDQSHTGDGLKVAEVIESGPFSKAESKVKAGTIITTINGIKITAEMNVNQVLNNLGRLPVQVVLSQGSEQWTETIRPISLGQEYGLLYKRWVKRNQAFTEDYSKGKIAYVHVRGMNESSFRAVYSDLMGKYHDYDAVVVDTRFNGGGWLHDDLATFLSGQKYMTFSPRGQENMGSEPMFKWKQPSIVLMSEGNYSDAHMFPYVYRALGIGKLIGMPVAGTGTAVWWERQIDGITVFGIPQVGMKGTDGKLLENQNLMPDIRVDNDPSTVVTGEDKQLKAAIDELLKTGTKDH